MKQTLWKNVRTYVYDKIERSSSEMKSLLINSVFYSYSMLGDVKKNTYSNGTIEVYEYTSDGKVSRIIKLSGVSVSPTYGRNGNVTDILYADEKRTKFIYNQLCQLEEITDWLGTTRIELDALGRPLSVTDFAGRTVGYEWGSVGEKTKLVYPDGKETVYQYGEDGILSSLLDGGKEVRYRKAKGIRMDMMS